jgi:16S rRNA (cytosine1402-N4)-methyltransferase
MENDILHRTVLREEAIQYLNVLSNHNYIDCTLGGGGHTESILEQSGPKGRVIAFDLDDETIRRTQKRLLRFGKRLIILNKNFRTILDVKDQTLPLHGVLYDLGTSMDLLKNSGRGFSFLTDEPLDMRFSDEQEITAEDIVNTWKEKDLADAIFRYGEERWSRRIAKGLVTARGKKRIQRTFELAEVIGHAIPGRYRHGRIHFATRTFQALRILVNDELGALEESLQGAVKVLEKGGRVVVISFHSLEDRIVKHFFKTVQIQGIGTILTKKPIIPTEEEMRENPASRSAKLRALELCQ